MPVPKRKTARTKRNMRRSHHALTPASLSECANCGEKTQPHHVCRNCGFYAKRTVVNIDED